MPAVNTTNLRRVLPPVAFALLVFGLDLLFRAPAALAAGRLTAALLTPSLDAALLLLLVCLWAWLRLRGEGLVAALLSGFGLFLLAFRIADALVPVYFDRPFVLHSDLTYIPDLYALLRDTTSPWLFYPGVLLLAAALGSLGWALYRGLRAAHGFFVGPGYRYSFVGLTGGLMLLGLAGGFPVTGATTLPRVVEEATLLVRRSAYLQEQATYFEHQERELATLTDAAATPLDGLGGRNVLLFIVESYGYTLYSEPQHFEPIEADLRRCEASLEAAGYSVVSAFLTSPAFGGNSWLADSTLVTGLKIDDQSTYELLLDSEVKPMARYFNEAGYRTVAAMPAVTSAWPEGDFFGFRKKYYYRDFGYRGPSFKWAPMTDQFVLDAIHRREVVAADGPLFVQYVLISSHYPFNLIPRYFEDWSELGDGSLYAREDSLTVLPIPPGSSTAGAEGYVAAMRYELRLISEYLTRLLPPEDRSLIVILGDHQPFSGITGKGKLWSVPVHILSRERSVLQPFRSRGYTPGWIPRQPLPHPGMESFLPAFLEDFSSAAPARPVGLPGAGLSEAGLAGRDTP
jgi:hypothetical protein